MSGWIKLEKDLLVDVRVRRIVAAFSDTPYGQTVTQVRYGRNAAVTLVLGALAQLWMYADSFARDDDTVKLTPKDIDELTGIEGFAQLLPEDWLQVLDEASVKLPGFQAHNGTQAKKRANGALRAARFRAANGSASVTPERYERNAAALLDQTKTRPRPEKNGGTGGAEALQMHATLPHATWQEWLEHRRKRRWPVDPRTLGKQLALLAPYSAEEQKAIIENSIQAGWQGLFPPKGKAAPPAQTWRPGPEDL